MSIVLRNQVEASERSAEQLDSRLGVLLERPSLSHEVEALMELVVALFADLNRYVERWQADVERGDVAYDENAARSAHDLYVRLERTASHASELGRHVESWGLAVAGKAQFLNAWRSLRAVVSVSVDRVAESFAQALRGETKSLGDFADELSRDLDR